jgi:RNA polymerase sigma factor (sigma-70 family)
MSAEPHHRASVISLTGAEEVGANIAVPSSSEGMATHAPPPAGLTRTHALLEEIAGGQRGVQLRAQVAAATRGATPEQVEEAFQEACLRAARGCHGQSMGEVYVWLRKTTGTLLRDARERLKREVLVDHTAPEFRAVDPTAPPDEVVIKREERAEIDALTGAILDRLCDRERTIAILHSHGYARKEIAERLGLTARVVKRSVEDVLSTGRSQLAKFTGYGCAEGHELVCRYAFGLAAGREAQRAQLHLATCQQCGGMYERLDLWRERVAALLPVPPAAVDHGHTIERVIHAGAERVTSSHAVGGEKTGFRRHLAGAGGHLREHATSVYARAADPTPLAGARPGAVAAAVAGCLAIGGGATYCVKQSVGPITDLIDRPTVAQATPAPHKPKAKPRTHAVRIAAVATTPTVAAPPPTTTQVATTPPPPAATTQAAPPPSPQDEFEPTSAGSTTTSAATAAAATVPATTTTPATTTSTKHTPTAAPSSGPGEFNGP